MTTELITVDPKDYNLPETEANRLTENLGTFLTKRDTYKKQYNEIISKELDDETIEEARDLRLNLVKVRTQGINRWHKNAKAYFKAGGDFVDAIKREHIAINEEMEGTLKEIEDYYENLEKQRIQELKEKRESEIEPYIEEGDLEGMNLGEMSDDIWESVFEARKNSFDKKQLEAKREEEEKIERERKEKIHSQRKDALIPVWNFIKSIPEDLSELKEKDFDLLLKEGREGKAKDDAEKEKLRQQAQKVQERNNKMRELWSYTDLDSVEDLSDVDFDKVLKKATKVKEEKEEQLRLENEKKEKIAQRVRTLMPYWNFLDVSEEIVSKITDKEFEKLLKNGKALKQKDDERKAKEAEEKRIQEEKRRELESSSDKIKVLAFTKSLLELELPEVKDEKAVKVLEGVKTLLGKIDSYANEKL